MFVIGFADYVTDNATYGGTADSFHGTSTGKYSAAEDACASTGCSALALFRHAPATNQTK
jgi:hypothetical protein